MGTEDTTHRVGIISMIDDEQVAIEACFLEFFGAPIVRHLSRYSDFPFRVYHPGAEFCSPEESIALLYFHINSTGNVDAGNLVTAAIIEQQLDFVFLVGVAGGRAPKLKHFDIVVPTDVYFYELGKLANGSFDSYNRNVHPDPKLRNWARSVAMSLEWLEQLPQCFRQFDGAPSVAFGSLAAGDKVITDSNHQVWRDVYAHAPKTIATEMESYGCLRAAYETGVPALTIRGISDLLDDKDAHGAKDESNKRVAAAIAATFMSALLPHIRRTTSARPRAILLVSDCDLSDAELAKKILTELFGERLDPKIFQKGSLRITIEGDEEALRALAILVGAQLLGELSKRILFSAPGVKGAEAAVAIGERVRSRMTVLARRGQLPSSELRSMIIESKLVDDEVLQDIIAQRIQAEADRLSTRSIPSSGFELDRRNFAGPKPSNLPGSIGHLFKGREAFLDQLRESFKHNSAAAITGKAVHGLGGVGKTRTAIEYGHAYAADYAATLFLIGKSGNDLRDSLAALASATVLDLPERDAPDLDVRMAAVIRWLRTNPGWLLIVDNVDDEAAASAVRAFLDQVSRGNGHILITSRVSEWGHVVEPLELDLLSIPAAKDLLRESTPHRTKRADEEAELARLADEQLGCLSLALVQAAAHIDERRMGFADYGAQFEKEGQKLLAKLGKSAMRNLSYPLPVALTWQASFAQLSDTSRLLLDMLAWLSIEPIPRDLFAVWPQSESADLDEALAELTRYSLVHWEAENTAITLHRLVAQVTRDNLDEAARDQALGALFPWLFAVNTGMNASDVRCWPQLLPLLPHALLLFERTSDCGPYPRQTDVYNEYATLLQALARYSEAELIFRRALAHDEGSHGPDHPVVAIRLNNLALLLRETNRLTEAEALYRRALEIDEANYGSDHSEVATDLNNLAVLLQVTDRQAEAEALLRRALAIGEASEGPDHPHVAIRLNNLAELLRDTGRLIEAEPLYRRALSIHEASFGPDHPRVATQLNNLAVMLGATGRLAEAEPLLRRALAITEANYGPDHPTVAIRLNNLADLLGTTGRLEEAESLLRRTALIFLRSSKASGHLLPNAVPALQNYVVALVNAGREPQDTSAIIASVMIEAGFEPAELGPQVFGDDG